MKSKSGIPTLVSARGEDLPISSENLLKLMQDVLTKGAFFQFRVKGLSMTPFIKDGDLITIAPLSIDKPAIGKVVAFVHPESGHLVIHRIIGKQGSDFLIQGDNVSGQPDGLISTENIFGCVNRVERNGKRVILGLGMDRYFVAALSRNGLLNSFLNRLRGLKITYLK